MMDYRAIIRIDQVPQGAMRQVLFEQFSLLVANVAGEILIIDDLCPHEEASLSNGVLLGDKVRCPLHGSRFCLRTGQALEEPAEEPVSTYSCRVAGEWIEAQLP